MCKATTKDNKNRMVCTAVGKVAGLHGLDNRGFEYRQGKKIFLLLKTSRPAAGLIQPPSCSVGTGSCVFGGKRAGA